jgi:hypothetical protein
MFRQHADIYLSTDELNFNFLEIISAPTLDKLPNYSTIQIKSHNLIIMRVSKRYNMAFSSRCQLGQ